jgi:hypothetical protein
MNGLDSLGYREIKTGLQGCAGRYWVGQHLRMKFSEPDRYYAGQAFFSVTRVELRRPDGHERKKKNSSEENGGGLETG